MLSSYSNAPRVSDALASISPRLFSDFRCLEFDRSERPFTDTMLHVRNSLKAIYGGDGLELYQAWIEADDDLTREVGGRTGIRSSWERTSGPAYDEASATDQISKLAAASIDAADFATNEDRRRRDAAELREIFDYLRANPERLALDEDDFEASPGRELLEFAGDVTEHGMAERDASALIRKLLYPRDTAMIYGKSGAGKSFLALDLCWHIAQGRDWHGRKVRQSPVLYVSLEGVDGFRKRMRAYTKRHGDPGAMFARLRIPVSLDESTTGSDGVRKVIEAAKALQEKTGQRVGLIVIDTLARAISGADENAADAAMHYLQRRVEIITRATGAATLTVHHENKLGGIRGSTALNAGMDLVLHATGSHLDIEKAKDDDQGTIFRYDLEPVEIATADDGSPITSCVLRTSAAPVGRRPDLRPKPKALSPSQRLLVEIFGKAETEKGFVPDTGEPGRWCDMAKIREAFLERYPTGDADGRKAHQSRKRAWTRLINSLPPGFEAKVDPAGNNVLWAIDDPFPGLE